MTNEELAAEIADIAGRLGDLAVRLSAPKGTFVPTQTPFLEAVTQDGGYTPVKEITIEDVRAALTELSGKKGAAVTKKLLEPYQKLSDVPQTEWRYLIKTAKEWL